MADARRDRRRGAVAIEFILAAPVLMLIVFGGLELGRVMATKHRLQDAVNYAARAAVVASVDDPAALSNAAISASVRLRMGDELGRCNPVVTTSEIPGAGPGMRALEVRATCTPPRLFQIEELPSVTLDVVAVMPLSP